MKHMTKDEYKTYKYAKRSEFMTDEEIKRIDGYISKLLQNKGEMQTHYTSWKEIEEQYKSEQAEIPNMPNSRVNVLLSNIEGQVSQMIEKNIAVTTKGAGPSDQQFSEWGKVMLDWTIRKNKPKQLLAQLFRRLVKFGNCFISVSWDSKAFNDFGIAKLSATPLNRIFIDGKIKDPSRLQEGEYIAEAITYGEEMFIERYGEEKASMIDYGVTGIIEDATVFEEIDTYDDDTAASVILWWSKHKGKLRLEEFSGDGCLLYDSHKTGGKKDNQKNSDYNHKSYNKYVNDKYPYFFTGLYQVEGSFWCFGDGKLLKPLQDLINELYDKIRICARPDLILIDTNAEVDVEDFNENSLAPRYFDGTNNVTDPVKSVKWGTVNEAYWRLLSAVHDEFQRVSRFSDLMIGSRATSDTATEATIQQQQGSAATDYKKTMVQETLVDVCEYSLGLMMENYTRGKAFRITEDKDEYMWIDARQLTEIPVMKPATMTFGKQYGDVHKESPKWENVEENGKPVTKIIDLDIDINIGAGLPKNQAFLWQMAERIAGLIMTDANGLPRNLVNYEEMRKFLKDFVGLPLTDTDKLPPAMPVNPMAQQQQPSNVTPMPNPNTPGLTPGMRPSPQRVAGGY